MREKSQTKKSFCKIQIKNKPFVLEEIWTYQKKDNVNLYSLVGINPNSDDFSERYGWMFEGCVGLFLVEKSAWKKRIKH